jgi:hypothetical protein
VDHRRAAVGDGDRELPVDRGRQRDGELVLRAVIVVVAVVISPVTRPSATPVGLQLRETS